MSISSGVLIKTLNKTCLNALQSAAGLCLSRTNPSVEVEHWLVKLAELPDSDLARIFRQFEVDTAHLLRDLTRVIDGFRTGNQRTPTLSLRIDQLVRTAWVTASLEYQARHVRSGTLLLALLEDEELGRLACDSSRELAKIKVEVLQANLMKLVAGSPEDEGPASGAAPGAGPEGQPTAVTQTPALDQYTVNLTERARKGEIDPVIGREAEVRQMVDILIRRRQNNPILTGEAGVGKTAVVEGLAVRIAQGDVPPLLKNVEHPHPRPRPAPGRCRSQGGVREPAQAGHRRGQGFARADHPVHRRGAHHDRGRRPGRAERRGQPAQAGPGPRRAPHHRRDDLGRVQEVFREGRGARAAVPGRQGRGTDGGPRHPDDARHHRDAREAPWRADPRGGHRERRQALAQVHPRPAASRQVRQPAGHRQRPGGDRSERHPARRRGLPPQHRPPQGRARHTQTRGARPALPTTIGSPSGRQDLDRARARLSELEARWEQERKRVEEIQRTDPDARGPLRRGGVGGHARRRALPPIRGTGRHAGRARGQVGRPPQASGRISAHAGLCRRADHRRGRRRLDGDPRRQDDDRRDPDGAQSAVPSSSSGSSASRTRWRRSASGSVRRGPT